MDKKKKKHEEGLKMHTGAQAGSDTYFYWLLLISFTSILFCVATTQMCWMTYAWDKTTDSYSDDNQKFLFLFSNKYT